jgi:2',3'-cyclic-nucleotide 2'-phosphodiesterase (5'-nucleotidase family)
VLPHIQPEDGVEILQNIPDVSVVIEGHDYRGMEKPAEVEGRVAAGCRGYGVELGRMDLDVDLAHEKLSSWSWKRLPVDATTIPADTDVKKAVDAWEGRVSKLVDVRIGDAKRDFTPVDVLHLVEKAIRDEEHADFTFINARGIRDRLTKGPILARHVWNILPFDNRVVVARVAGRMIGPEIRKGRVIELDREYTLATADYVVENESQRASLGLAEIEFKKLKWTLRDLVIQWIRKQRVLE